MEKYCVAAVFNFIILLSTIKEIQPFSIADYTHYFDYVPYRNDGLAAFDDFRTAAYPPTHLRDRKMELGKIKLQVEDVLNKPTWPTNWPYGVEDFRPLDYTRDEVINTMALYQYSQSLLVSDHVTIIPGIFRLPIRRHFINPKDQIAMREHLSQYMFDGAKVLELFSVYESILPTDSVKLGPTVGVGWFKDEMECNADLDDFIEQDISIDPYLPLKDNYFDFVVMPAMFQLLQLPRETFQEINRVLKPGGMVICGVKL